MDNMETAECQSEDKQIVDQLSKKPKNTNTSF
jgi:hypothetical protein